MLLATLLTRSSPHVETEHSVEATCFTFFSQFLAIKIATPFIFGQSFSGPWSFTSLFAACALILALLPWYHPLGLLLVTTLSAWECWHTWPFTINHGGLECIALVLMCLVPSSAPSLPSPYSPAAMIKLMMISVWFYSGLHKILDGYYLNGEFFALEVASAESSLGLHLREILHLIARFGGLPESSDVLVCCTSKPFSLPAWQSTLLLALSWLTILTELFLPLTLFFSRTRTLGILSLFIFQGTIAYFSGEIDFAFTAYAILLLFVPHLARWGYPLLAGIFLWDSL